MTSESTPSPSTSWPLLSMLATTMINSLHSSSSSSSSSYKILALYKFVSPKLSTETLTSLQKEIETTCRQYHARGTLLLAPEGINGTICYPYTEDKQQQKKDDDDDDDGRRNGDQEDDQQDPLLEYLQSKFSNQLRTRSSSHDRPVFARLKIKLKSEIVTMHWWGDASNTLGGDVNTADTSPTDRHCAFDVCDPNRQVGQYVKPAEWNSLIMDPNTIVVDTRNEYEIKVGTFRNAVNPHTQSFVEFPQWMKENLCRLQENDKQSMNENPGHDKNNSDDDTTVESSSRKNQKQEQQMTYSTLPLNDDSDKKKKKKKKIAMFCTGGIRCEKATNAALQLIRDNDDVEQVYHLEGGILAYLDEIPPEQSLFDGDCYVFDQRVAVTYGLKPSPTFKKSCYACRYPLSQADIDSEHFKEGVSCSHCYNSLTEKQRERALQRHRQVEEAMKSGKIHMFDSKYDDDVANAMSTSTAKRSKV